MSKVLVDLNEGEQLIAVRVPEGCTIKNIAFSAQYAGWNTEQFRRIDAPQEAGPIKLSNLIIEYDAAPDDTGWEMPHPIFQLAQDRDILAERVSELEQQLSPTPTEQLSELQAKLDEAYLLLGWLYCSYKFSKTTSAKIEAIVPQLNQFSATHDERREEWQPIETAPKDGTIVDLWIDGEFAGRRSDCYFGLPHHDCGEMGSYCDSEVHGMNECWIDSCLNSECFEKPTHWRPLPQSPTHDERREE